MLAMNFLRIKPLDAIMASARRNALEPTLGAWQLTLLGVGAIIGTGIFVLTSEAAQKAGPGMVISFVIAAFVCATAALCYAEVAAMIPVSGSAYTYTYAVMGEVMAWLVGWALVLEYAVSASAVAVGWSGYFVGQLHGWFGITLPTALTQGPYAGGLINLPAVTISLLITWLLMIGTSESARVNAMLVGVKVTALALFVILSIPAMRAENFHPLMPLGWASGDGAGVVSAASSIFFAYIGFDAVSTAAEETKNPQRNVPLGLIGSLVICTVFYMLVAAGAIGSPLGAQPVMSASGHWLAPGSAELAARCAAIVGGGAVEPLACSNEALAHVLREIGYMKLGNLVGLAAFVALPSVILVMIYGQARMFFVMSRDGLLPARLSRIHPKWKTPHIITMITGTGVALGSAFLPVGKLADMCNAGTLFAFVAVAIALMVLRRTDPGRARPFRTPLVWLVGPLTILGCLILYLRLPFDAKMVLPIWGGIGLLLYFAYGYRHSLMGRGVVEVHETDIIAPPVPGIH
jgi:APA family basic amino acid/polyamine antiporter